MRANQLDPNDGGFDPPDDEKNKRIDDIENPQTLVINCGDPFMHHFDPRTRLCSCTWNGYRVR